MGRGYGIGLLALSQHRTGSAAELQGAAGQACEPAGAEPLPPRRERRHGGTDACSVDEVRAGT